ncbi:ParA family protein [Pelagibius sp. Alg239-R121]|uniref:ParA family protein n=1 Tax=Pelagibius sp. Alg239-R121 TaxID=2993448 RepID=UPI0024A679A8|nr:ParA family protein [Pelagibius sp. Alg239-R121]
MKKTAQIITAVQQKGGAGKSTMISCLAAAMSDDGAKVLIIDTDPQESCVEWAEQNEVSNLDVVPHHKEDSVFDLIDKLESRYDVILVDTAGYDSRMATYAIQASDLILIPSGGSKKDIMGAARTWLHANNLTKRNREAPEVKIVLWKVKPGTNVLSNAKESLEKSGLPVLSAIVPNLTGFDEISWTGGLPDGKARQSVKQFLASLQLGKHLQFYERKAA